jgi:hypothetical protein
LSIFGLGKPHLMRIRGTNLNVQVPTRLRINKIPIDCICVPPSSPVASKARISIQRVVEVPRHKLCPIGQSLKTPQRYVSDENGTNIDSRKSRGNSAW